MNSKVTEEGDVVLIRWKDKNTVNVTSTQFGVGDGGLAKRLSASRKERIDIQCPQVILENNRHIGGVDKLDFVMFLYPIRIKTTKRPVQMISHFISFGLANSRLQYLRDASAESFSRKNTKDMLDFQTGVALTLVFRNKPAKKKCG